MGNQMKAMRLAQGDMMKQMMGGRGMMGGGMMGGGMGMAWRERTAAVSPRKT